MTKSVFARAAAIVVLGLFSVAGHAAFVNEGGGGEVRVVGKLGGEDKAVGMGRNVQLRDAIRQIVPQDYSMQFGPGTNPLLDRRVTWKGGRAWTDVLSEVVEDVPWLSIEVDVATKLVTITAARAAVTDAPTVGTASVWRLRRGDKISDAVSAWARDAGWNGVFWEAPELVSDIDVMLTGTLQEAVTRTIEALNQNGSHLAVFYYGGNKVIRVMEAK